MGDKTIECKHLCLLAMEDTLHMANMGWWYYTLIGHVIHYVRDMDTLINNDVHRQVVVGDE